jgi:phosphatidylethanolamine-binding protein (PEBP) family uncharacterized protein
MIEHAALSSLLNQSFARRYPMKNRLGKLVRPTPFNAYIIGIAIALGGTLSACSGGGGSDSSSATTTTTTVVNTIAGAPTMTSATAGNASAVVAFTAPSSNGGAAITAYTVTCTATAPSASVTSTGASSPITISGMTNGISYACSMTATNSVGISAASNIISVTPIAPIVTPPSSGTFSVTSTVGADGGTLPADYTCDGTGATPQLAWSGAPTGTTEYAVLMTTLPGDGTTKWNWVLYGIPGGTKALAKDTFGQGTLGVGSDGPNNAYNPPCSQGSGAKIYSYTVYALSGSPTISVAPSRVTGQIIADAIASLTLAKATLNLSVTRTTSTGSSAACVTIRNSTLASTTGAAGVNCDSTYAYVSSYGLATHMMMNGITATNLQFPLAQNFNGANAWKIPLAPAIAATTTTAVDGPIGVAINGVPIFNPCKQGGCQNGDTKVLGELDVCNGHAGRADDYHYHAAPICMMAGQTNTKYWDTHPVGWALDGFAIFGYNNADGTTATRDGVCGGNTLAVSNAPSGYSYHVTEVSPYVLSCFRGTPSPDLINQGSKYFPIRQPPVTPFPVSAMTLTTDASDGYQVLQFSSAISFTTTATGSDQYANSAGIYRIRYKAVSGTALTSLLAQAQNTNKTACWNFQFVASATGTTATQPTISYCR